jgi:hypothetical protein
VLCILFNAVLFTFREAKISLSILIGLMKNRLLLLVSSISRCGILLVQSTRAPRENSVKRIIYYKVWPLSAIRLSLVPQVVIFKYGMEIPSLVMLVRSYTLVALKQLKWNRNSKFYIQIIIVKVVYFFLSFMKKAYLLEERIKWLIFLMLLP